MSGKLITWREIETEMINYLKANESAVIDKNVYCDKILVESTVNLTELAKALEERFGK